MTFSLSKGLTALCLAAAIAAPASAEDLTVDTFRGPAQVPAAPETIVVLDVSAVDTIDALGVPIAAVPNSLYVPFLDDVAASAEPVGSLFEPDFEAIANLAPDLIVAGGRSSKQTEMLARIAPTVDMTIPADDHMALALARLDTYGEIFDREQQAAEIRADFDAKLEAARAAVDGKGKALIVLTNGPKVSAYGAGSRFGWIHTALDLPEAREGVDVQTHGEAISFEFINEVNPDWLIVIDRGAAIGAEGASAQATLDNELVAQTTAWETGQVIYPDPARLYISGGGIQSMSHVLDQLTEAFSK